MWGEVRVTWDGMDRTIGLVLPPDWKPGAGFSGKVNAMGKKKTQRATKQAESGASGGAGWTINSQSAIVTIWESRDDKGKPVYAVTFNHRREPVPPPEGEKGAPSVMLAFAKVERADTLKKPDDL